MCEALRFPACPVTRYACDAMLAQHIYERVIDPDGARDRDDPEAMTG